MSVLVLLSSFINVHSGLFPSVSTSAPLLLASVSTGRVSADDFIVSRFLVSWSGATGIVEDFIVFLILASGSGATDDSLIS